MLSEHSMMQTKTWEEVEMTKGIFAKIAATILIIFSPYLPGCNSDSPLILNSSRHHCSFSLRCHLNYSWNSLHKRNRKANLTCTKIMAVVPAKACSRMWYCSSQCQKGPEVFQTMQINAQGLECKNNLMKSCRKLFLRIDKINTH